MTVSSPKSAPSKPNVPDGRSPLWRGHNVFRVVTMCYACLWVVVQYRYYAVPWASIPVITGVVLWTAFTVWRYWHRAGRTNLLVFADQIVVTVLFLSSEFILTEHQMLTAKPSVVTTWHATAVTAAGVQWGPVGGALSAVWATACNFAVRGYFDPGMTLDTLLMLCAGIGLGVASHTARASTERLARALRAEAATAERERLARSIHDSVLQVLARVRRRGGELGGEAAELARLAGEQEIALRALVATGPQDVSGDAERGETDLAARLQVLRTGRVHVSVPADPVLLAEPAGSDVFAAVGEALANVERHAGPEAQAWVLLEELPDSVVLSVRDDGPGIDEGRLTAAADEGRMGVAQSIRGRVEQLGGSVGLDTAPGEGTEWELRVPRSGTATAATGRKGGQR